MNCSAQGGVLNHEEHHRAKRSAFVASIAASLLVLGVLAGCSGSSSQASSSQESSASYESSAVFEVSDVAADASDEAEAELLQIGKDVEGALSM